MVASTIATAELVSARSRTERSRRDGEPQPALGTRFDPQGIDSEEAGTSALTIGLIDCYRLSQECLMKAFEGVNSHLTVLAYTSVRDCIEREPSDLDLIIYYSHSNDASEMATTRTISAIRASFADIPLIVLSDAEDAHQPKTIRSTLKSGAHGFLPTRTTGIPIAIAAIQFVRAGGIFAPLDLLLTNRPDRVATLADAARQSRLTSRQMAVLSHLQQGKANKIIAHELGMSESTVKVHVRNIMRKMGATNRTEAAYKAQKLWDDAGLARLSDL